ATPWASGPMASARVVSSVTSRIEGRAPPGAAEPGAGRSFAHPADNAAATATPATAASRTSARRLRGALATGLLEETRLRQQLLARVRFDGREAGEILVPGRRDEDDVFEPDVDAVVRNRHRRLDREDHARLELGERHRDVVDLHPDHVAEAAAAVRRLRPVA